MVARTIPMLAAVAAAALAMLSACSTYSESGGESVADYRAREAEEAIKAFKAKDPSLEKFFRNAAGYAVFPAITKGALGVGAAHGDDGVVYEKGKIIGYADVTQVTVGAQIGGQSFSEIIFFQTPSKLEEFRQDRVEFAANASAVAAASGAGAAGDYSEGVAVFVLPRGGLMLEAAIGGQKFNFSPKEQPRGARSAASAAERAP